MKASYTSIAATLIGAVMMVSLPDYSTPSSSSIDGCVSALLFQMAIASEPNQKHEVSSGDYVQSGLFQALPDNFDLATEIKSQLDRAGSFLDLRKFRWLSSKFTKEDLRALESPVAIQKVKNLNLDDLPVDDRALEAASRLHLEVINLIHTPVHDLHALKGMNSLADFRGERCQINSQGIVVLSQLPHMSIIVIPQTGITDSDLAQLSKSTSLRFLGCSQCPNITKAALAKLKKQHPNCTISADLVKLFREPNASELQQIDRSLMGVSEYGLADQALEKLIRSWEARKGAQDYHSISLAYMMRGNCQRALKRPKEARHYYLEALRKSESAVEIKGPVQDAFASFCDEQKDFATARKLRENRPVTE